MTNKQNEIPFWLHISRVLPGMEINMLMPGPDYYKVVSVELDKKTGNYLIQYNDEPLKFVTGSYSNCYIKETEEFKKDVIYEQVTK